MSDGLVNEFLGGLTGVDHESVGELHRLGSGGSQFTGDDDFATLGAGFHDESQDTVTSSVDQKDQPTFPTRLRPDSPSDSQTTQQLVSQRLGLSNSAQSSVLDLFSVKLQRVFGELESLGNQRGQFPDSSSLFTENILSVGRSDDDFGLGVGHSDFTARVAFLGEFSSAEGEGLVLGGGRWVWLDVISAFHIRLITPINLSVLPAFFSLPPFAPSRLAMTLLNAYSQEFTQFGLENTISDKLSLLGDLGGHDVDL